MICRSGAPRPAPRCTLVTGASSGIGRAFAEALPASTHLILTARSEAALADVAAALPASDRTIDLVAADLTTDPGRRTVIAAAERAEVDLVVSNAGVGCLGRLIDHEASEERAVVELNVTTPLVFSHALLPGMIARARQEGRNAGFIIVSSEAAFSPLPYFASYVASKAFDLVLAESLAAELNDEPVDVMALCPGATRSAFGGRAGFAAGNMPWAADPGAVAREALEALGRRRVLLSGQARRAALTPLWLSREIAARGLGLVMSRVVRRQSGSSVSGA